MGPWAGCWRFGLHPAQAEPRLHLAPRPNRTDLARHRALPGPPLRVAISGASGLVGTGVAAFLSTGGHGSVAWSGATAAGDPERSSGTLSPARSTPPTSRGCDAVVHLAGESIAAGRWTAERKRRIRDSRVGAPG